MKKLTRISAVLLAGLAVSPLTYGQAQNEYGSLDASGGITKANCTVLGSDTKVILSANSYLAYKCSPVYNLVKLMSCNSAGSRTPETKDCVWVPDDSLVGTDNPETSIIDPGSWNDASCGSSADQFDIVGGRYFTQSTAGGGIATSGGAATDTCDGATMEAALAQ